MAHHAEGSYYIPHGTKWPIVGSVGMATMLASAAMWMNGSDAARWTFVVGIALLIYMMFGWFGQVIRESESGTYNDQVDTSFRLGMAWFIFSEVMFFACFFGALFYARALVVPWLGGEGVGASTNEFLWQGYEAVWPTNGPGDLGQLVTWLAATVALGFIFVFLQAEEYIEAYQELGLTLGSGIYGSTFFMLTGFHGMHVTLGAIMLLVIMLRSMRGHFKPEQHFGFEAVAWYWHFVDVVWLGLFIFVYVL
jgi:cytochrome c oxidase subunit 3